MMSQETLFWQDPLLMTKFLIKILLNMEIGIFLFIDFILNFLKNRIKMNFYIFILNQIYLTVCFNFFFLLNFFKYYFLYFFFRHFFYQFIDYVNGKVIYKLFNELNVQIAFYDVSYANLNNPSQYPTMKIFFGWDDFRIGSHMKGSLRESNFFAKKQKHAIINSKICRRCLDGYFSKNNECTLCLNNCGKCVSEISYHCLTCKPNYKLIIREVFNNEKVGSCVLIANIFGYTTNEFPELLPQIKYTEVIDKNEIYFNKNETYTRFSIYPFNSNDFPVLNRLKLFPFLSTFFFLKY